MLAKIFVPTLSFIFCFGWFYGLILNYGCWTAYYWVLRNIFNMDSLSSLDEFFLLDNQMNRANILTVIKTNKVPNVMYLREVIIKLALVHPRLSHNLQKFMGEYFFCKMTGEHLAKAIEESFVINHEIKSDDDIAKFLAEEQIIRDPLETFQYKMTFVPDFSKTESCVILKFHHCLADGVTTIAVTSTLTDEGYNVNNFPRLIPRLSLLKTVAFSFFKILLMPYSIYLAQVAVLKKGSNNEIFPIGSELIGKKKVAFSKPLEIGELRDVLKKKKISLNNYICVTAQLALAQIAVRTEKMQVSIPITLKDYPESIKSIKIGNEFAALPFQFNFPKVRDISSFKQMLEQQKLQVGAAKNLCLGLGFYYMMNYFVSVLRYKMCYDWKRICSNYTTVFSCVPGPKKPWEFEGMKVKQVFYIVTGAGALGCGIGVITQNDKCQVTVACDQAYFPNDTHKVFIKKFEEIFTEAIGQI